MLGEYPDTAFIGLTFDGTFLYPQRDGVTVNGNPGLF